jgi:two-component system chemotaxis response regulator CheB
MSEVKVVRRWQANPPVSRPAVQPTVQKVEKAPVSQPSSTSRIQTPQIVAIGVSTGGPPVLRTILNLLGTGFPLPILIVQHISPGFLQSMVEWLIQTTGFPTRIALSGEKPRPGYAYFAPDDSHLVVQGTRDAARLVLSPAPPECNLRPAVAPLFRSVANSYGAGAIGILLTGMGKDGAPELKLLREAGAVTIAQDKDSSVVHGMPGEAIALNAARYVLPPEAIAEKLLQLAISR